MDKMKNAIKHVQKELKESIGREYLVKHFDEIIKTVKNNDNSYDSDLQIDDIKSDLKKSGIL